MNIVLSPLLARARLRNYQRGIYEQPDPITQRLLPKKVVADLPSV